MASERYIRGRAASIGVQISLSRVRTPEDPSYGLWRARGSMPVIWSIDQTGAIDRSPDQFEPTLWTPYAFRLRDIAMAVETAIQRGTDDGPEVLNLPAWPDLKPIYKVLTRWTPTYTGARDLGKLLRDRQET